VPSDRARILIVITKMPSLCFFALLQSLRSFAFGSHPPYVENVRKTNATVVVAYG
jgi:hypothetical protein